MASANERDIKLALSSVIDPDFGKDVVSLGFLKGIRVEGTTVHIHIERSAPIGPVREELRQKVGDALRKLDGVRDVALELSWNAPETPRDDQKPTPVPQIKNIIAVASGKGGVGKSTVAANLALGLAQAGAKAGLLDCDFYGPSVPMMLGVSKADLRQVGEKIAPAEKHGLEILSFGFFVGERDPVIWRGPMLDSAIRQFFTDIQWSPLDYLVIDLPPGTGDVQLSVCQRVPLMGAIVVTTPQEVSLADVYRAVSMFNKVQVPVIGVVENMSYFVDPAGNRHTIFGEGGGERLSKEIGAELLGRVPLDPRVARGGDAGQPVLLSESDDAEVVQAFRTVARNAATQISIFQQQREAQPLIQITRA